MKKISCFISVLFMCCSSLAMASGSVQVSDTAMWGSFNVRYNPDTDAFIRVRSGTVGGGMEGQIIFHAWDGTQHFKCTVQTSNTLYPFAREMLFNAGNGTYIRARADYSGGECNSLYFENSSHYLD